MVAFGYFLWYGNLVTQVNRNTQKEVRIFILYKMQTLFWHTSFAYVELVRQQGASIFGTQLRAAHFFV